MANNLGRSILNSLSGGGRVRDYAHASKVFRPNGFSRAGKSKFLFHVYFNLNRNLGINLSPRELSYMVKSAELPKFNFDIRIQNQYNKKNLTQHKINYQPVSIRFHDDNGNEIRELWRSYYNYFISDGRYTESMSWPTDIYYPGDARLVNRWGLDSDSDEGFFRSIDIYSLYAGESFKISLIKPVISAFNHDTHDYAEGNSLMEHTMTIQYSSVKYTNGYWSGTPGFADFQFYDNQPSDLAGDYAGYQIDPRTGAIFDPGEQEYDQYQDQTNLATSDQNNAGENLDKPAQQSFTNVDIENILSNQEQGTNSFVFPTAYPEDGFTYGENTGAVDAGRETTVVTEGTELQDGRKYLGVFPEDTWQRQLEEQGYDPRSIIQAEKSVQVSIDNGDVIDNSGAARLGKQFIDAPQSVTNQTKVNLTSDDENYAVTFQNQSVLTPNYNGKSWESDLEQKGYNQTQISKVRESLNSTRLAPSVDLTVYAENYLRNTFTA
jgi:hypothetical protein